MADTFKNVSNQSNPASRHFDVVTGDTEAANFAVMPRAIYCVTAGTAQIVDEAGTVLAYPMLAGATLNFRAPRINTTSTTGTYRGWY